MSLSVFAKIPVPTLELEQPVHYVDSAVSVVKFREPLVSGDVKRKLHRHVLDLKLNPEYIQHLGIYDLVAKVYNLGVSNHPLNQYRLWLLVSTLEILIFEFDDYFDKSLLRTPENIAKLSKEMRGVLRSLSRHNLSGLQGSLEDWPAEVPCKQAYLWHLREAEDLREGTAQLIHDTFVDYCYGVEVEVTEWQSDVNKGDLTAWNLDRYNDARKHSVGLAYAIVGPLYIANKWLQKEHIITCTDLVYDASILTVLGNDILGMNRDRGDSGTMTSLKLLASSSEVVQYHNELVEVLHKKVIELECNTRHYMEEVEAAVVAFFLWQSRAERYAV
nr:sesquiterpene synthase uBuTS-4 [Bubarida sp. uBuTS-4]